MKELRVDVAIVQHRPMTELSHQKGTSFEFLQDDVHKFGSLRLADLYPDPWVRNAELHFIFTEVTPLCLFFVRAY